MDSVAGQSANERFAQANIRVALSDHFTAFDCLVYWYFQSNTDYLTGLVRPFKRADLMDVFGVSVDTVKRSLKRLRSSGWITLEDLGHEGQRPTLHNWPSGEDTFHGIGDTKFAKYLDGKGWARLSREIMFSGLSPRQIRIWVVLMILKGHNRNRPESFGWAYITHAELAALIRDLGSKLHPKTVGSDTEQLEERGLVKIDEYAVHGRMNRYRPTDQIHIVMAEVEPKAMPEEPSEIGKTMWTQGWLTSEYIHVCVELLDLWIGGTIGEDWWEHDEERGEEYDTVLYAIKNALKEIGDPELVRIRINTGLETYGPGYPLDIVNKVLDFDADPLSEEELTKRPNHIDSH
ncbi:hypothetical protein [Streptosporangium roseum]|uniref:hypothetical protein n=1 Tax=Streptosporangium roseum TaxID=2001 RepID=UPI00332919E6